MGLAVVFRSWSLTISFDAPMLGQHFWDTAFGLYLLVPFALSILVILLETGIVEKRHKLVTGVMWTALLLLLLAHPLLVPWCNLPAYREMLILMTHKIGSPVFLTQLGIIGFYSWAWIRRVPYAEFCVCVSLIVISKLDPQGFVRSDFRIRSVCHSALAISGHRNAAVNPGDSHEELVPLSARRNCTGLRFRKFGFVCTAFTAIHTGLVAPAVARRAADRTVLQG